MSDNTLSGGNWWQNWYKDNVLKGSVKKDSLTDDYSPGFFEGIGSRVLGIDPEGYADNLGIAVEDKAGERVLEAAGLTKGEVGITGKTTKTGATAALNDYRETKAEEAAEKAHERATELPLAQLEANTEATKESNEITRANNEATIALAYSRDKQQAADRLEDRIARRENQAQELEYLKMRDRKEDRRYNEQIDRQMRADRRQGLSSLAAGLAALGAAFAL